MTTRRFSAPHRSGFASIIAVVLVGLVGAALATTATLMRADVLRTRRAGADVQIRQLLLAGQVAAQERLSSGAISNEDAVTIQLPGPLTIDGAALTLRRIAPDENGSTATVEIIAVSASYQRLQTLRYVHDQDQWALAAAELGALQSQPASGEIVAPEQHR